MPKIPCTVGILTLNSAATLERCLTSVRDFAEVIVFDGNSTDGTQDIARRFGARVVPQVESAEQNVRITDFAATRNRLFTFVTQPWFFDLDSDEIMSEALRDQIRTAVAGQPAAYSVPRRAIVNGTVVRHAFLYPDRYIRLYPMVAGVGFHPKKALHEKILLPQDLPVRSLDAPVLAPWPSYADARAKDERYLALVAAEVVTPQRGLRRKLLKSALVNLAKGIHIGLVSVAIGIRYGGRDVLSIKHWSRFVRYHWRIGLLRMRQTFRRYGASS